MHAIVVPYVYMTANHGLSLQEGLACMCGCDVLPSGCMVSESASPTINTYLNKHINTHTNTYIHTCMCSMASYHQPAWASIRTRWLGKKETQRMIFLNCSAIYPFEPNSHDYGMDVLHNPALQSDVLKVIASQRLTLAGPYPQQRLPANVSQ